MRINAVMEKFLLIVVCLTMNSGCSLNLEKKTFKLGDAGLLISKPECGPPCFLGIIPGITKESEVWNILKEQPFDYCQADNNESGGRVRSIDCTPGVLIEFQKGTDVVNAIGITPTQSITVGDIVKSRGYPDGVKVVVGGTPEEKPYSVMLLMFDKFQTVISLPQRDGNTYNLDPSSVIEGFLYLDSDSYTHYKMNSVDWKGFGEY